MGSVQLPMVWNVDNAEGARAPREIANNVPTEALPLIPLNQWLAIPAKSYHADKRAASQGSMCEALRSPAHFLAEWARPPSTPNKAMELGTMVHDVVLEPDAHEIRIPPEEPDADGRTKEGKALKAEWKERLAEFEASIKETDIVTDTSTRDRVLRIRDAVLSHPAARELLQGARTEQTVYWIDDETGLLMRARVDVLQGGVVLGDLKTTIDASEEAFGKTIENSRYHVQSAHYLAGANTVPRPASVPLGREHWHFIAAEKEAPFAVAVYRLTPAAYNRGVGLWRQAVTTVAGAVRENKWPAYPSQVREIDLPAWAYRTAGEVAW